MTDNTIHINSTLRMFSAMARQAVSASGASFSSFLQKASSEDMAAYKSAIVERINAMPMDPSHTGDDLLIDISDEGWTAMRQDPSYEAWVLDTIQDQLTWNNPYASLTGGCMVHLKFGASPEEYRGDSWNKGSGDIGDITGSPKKSYWEERQERARKMSEIDEQIGDARARARLAAERARIRGDNTALPDDASAASEILTILMASYMQTPPG